MSLKFFAAFFLLVLVATSQAQTLTNQIYPDPYASSRMIMTYDGNIIFQFPNYDVSIDGSPSFAGQGNGRQKIQSDQGVQPVRDVAAVAPFAPVADASDFTDLDGTQGGPSIIGEQVSTKVIFKTDQGSWDGSNFATFSNYNYNLSSNFYSDGVIGNPSERWSGRRCPSDSDPFRAGPGRPNKREPVWTEPFVSLPSKSSYTIEKMALSGQSAITYLPPPLPLNSQMPTKLDAFDAPNGAVWDYEMKERKNAANGARVIPLSHTDDIYDETSGVDADTNADSNYAEQEYRSETHRYPPPPYSFPMNAAYHAAPLSSSFGNSLPANVLQANYLRTTQANLVRENRSQPVDRQTNVVPANLSRIHSQPVGSVPVDYANPNINSTSGVPYGLGTRRPWSPPAASFGGGGVPSTANGPTTRFSDSPTYTFPYQRRP